MVKMQNCKPNEEKFNEFNSRGKGKVIMYHYRTSQGELFSCIGKNIDVCRKKKDEWLSRRI